MNCRLGPGKEGLQPNLGPLLIVRSSTLVVFVPVNPKQFPARGQESTVPASKAIMNSETVNRRNQISLLRAEVGIGRLSVLQTRVLSNNSISGLAIDIRVSIPQMGI